ncbi:unnamed protein product, partial [marine sediment metagenome]
DIIEGKLEAEQGKREEIEELLSEWYKKSKRRVKWKRA